MYLFPESEFHSPTLNIDDTTKKNEILKTLEKFKLSIDTVDAIKNVFVDEMQVGLSSAATKKSCLQMENTFIPYLPTGDEKGFYLSLDLGSTNFRVILSKLTGNEETDEFVVKYYDIPENYKVAKSSQKLFEHIANCIHDFLSCLPELNGIRIPLGFTFSFPMVQKAIDVGLLVTWTKCYDLPDVVNKNAVEFLQKAMTEKQLNVEIVAILNDTTGTLVKGAYLDDHCGIGMILGTGFNICYIEKAENVEKWLDRHKYSQVLIDMECGAFGDNGCIDFMKTEFDRQIDDASLFKGSFTFEKMFSGRFVGDLVRRILLHLSEKGLLFGGQITSLLGQTDSFPSALVSLIEEENGESAETRKAIESLGYSNYTSDDIVIVKYVCALVSIRGALLVSILLSALLERMQRDVVSIAIDGSLFSHPKYSQLLNDFVSELTPGKKFKLFAAKDGSGKGAGIVAAIADRMKRSE